jgi:hypothetical protein
VNALGKMLALDGMFALGMLALARFAPETKKAIEQQAKETLAQIAPETTEQLDSEWGRTQ